MEKYQFILALSFSLDEVNRELNLLTNISWIFFTETNHCMSQSENCLPIISDTHDIYPNYNCEELKGCVYVISGPSWVVSSKHSKQLDFFASQQVRFCVVVGLQEILSPFVPFSVLRKVWGGDWTYTYVKLCCPGVLFRYFRGLLYLFFFWNRDEERSNRKRVFQNSLQKEGV